MKRNFIAMFMMCCMLFVVFPNTVQSVQIEPIQPMWDNTSYVTAKIAFDGTSGTVSVFINGKAGVTNITADVNLYYKNTSGSWIEIEKGWNYNVNQRSLTVNESFTGVAGREYKIEVSGTVTKAGYVEAISATHTSMCS